MNSRIRVKDQCTLKIIISSWERTYKKASQDSLGMFSQHPILCQNGFGTIKIGVTEVVCIKAQTSKQKILWE